MATKSTVRLRKRGKAFKCDLCGRKLMSADALRVHQRTTHNIIKVKSVSESKPAKISKAPKLKPKPIKEARPPSPPKVRLPTPPKVRPANPPKVRQPSPPKVRPPNPPKGRPQNPPKVRPPSPPKVTPKKSNEKSNKDNDNPKTIDEKEEVEKVKVHFECPKCYRLFLTYFQANKHIGKFHCVNKEGLTVSPNSPDLIQPFRWEMCLKCSSKVKSIEEHECEEDSATEEEPEVYMCTACDVLTNIKNFYNHVTRMHGDGLESMFFPTTNEFTKWKNEMEKQTKVSYILDNTDQKHYYHCNIIKEKLPKLNAAYHCPSTIVVQEFSKGIQVHFYKKHYRHVCNEYKLTDKYKKYSVTSFFKDTESNNKEEAKANNRKDLYSHFKTLMDGVVADAAKVNIATLKMLIKKAQGLTSILINDNENGEDNDASSIQSLTDSQISEELNMEVTIPKMEIEESEVEIKRPKLSSCIEIPSPKIINSFSLANTELDKNIKSESCQSKDSDENSEDHPTTFNDTYRDFVVKNFPEIEIKRRTRNEKKVMKTKIGQYKPSLSPKEAKRPRLSTDKPKVDPDYEVKEQTDGCNILILKI